MKKAKFYKDMEEKVSKNETRFFELKKVINFFGNQQYRDEFGLVDVYAGYSKGGKGRGGKQLSSDEGFYSEPKRKYHTRLSRCC